VAKRFVQVIMQKYILLLLITMSLSFIS